MPPFRGGEACLDAGDLGELIAALRRDGYRVIGPARGDLAIMLEELTDATALPAGWTAVQEAGSYRLRRRDDTAVLAHAVSQDSWKRYLFAPALVLWRAARKGESFTVTAAADEAPRQAFLGVRACDLAAIAIQDRIFMQGPYAAADYAARRRTTFVIAVNCSVAGGTCFCVSMGTGPRATSGFDLALTEILEGGHRFLVEIGSEAGARLLASLRHREASPEDLEAAAGITAHVAAQMGRSMETADIQELLYGNLDHPRWDDVARRCLACTNCTLVCPTCFCATVEDVTALDGRHAEQRRRWDSCFTLGHSYVHGGSIRVSHRSRYRQWLVHKLCSWIDQFGTSGCVGCGRCITWCPVGIDITEEVAAIRGGRGVAVHAG